MAQDNWRWCGNCQGLYFAGNVGVFDGVRPGRCTSPDAHYRAPSGLYVLSLEGGGAGQTGWRWCHKCQGLWFAGNGVGGSCFAGGEHSQDGSGHYVVAFEGQGEGQPGWRWCHRCQGLWFAADEWSHRARCPAGEYHDATGSGNYVVEHLPRELAWFDALSGPNNLSGQVSQWLDRRDSVGTSYLTNEPSASTTDSGWWPRPSNPGRPAVRFGDDLGSPRKGLRLFGPGDPSGRPLLGLWRTPYTAVVVVQRTSARGDNYPLASVGVDCNAFGCAEDSVLHLGWQSDRNIRFGQWGDDVDLRGVPAFRSGGEVISIISATSDGRRKLVALDEPGFSRASTPRPDGRLLRDGTRPLSIGGPPHDMGWDFHFNGHVFEVILWAGALTPHQLDVKRVLLREKYGIGGATMAPTP